jgi:hypothetical protein
MPAARHIARAAGRCGPCVWVTQASEPPLQGTAMPRVGRNPCTSDRDDVVVPAAHAGSLIQTTIGTVLAPLVGQVDALRLTVERQADELRTLERENGRQAAELERAAAAIVTLSDELAAERAKSTLEASTGPVPAGSTPGAIHGARVAVRASMAGGCGDRHGDRLGGAARALRAGPLDGRTSGAVPHDAGTETTSATV